MPTSSESLTRGPFLYGGVVMGTQKDKIIISNFKGPIPKRCRICKQKKLLSDFDPDETTFDRHGAICKVCDTLFLYL